MADQSVSQHHQHSDLEGYIFTLMHIVRLAAITFLLPLCAPSMREDSLSARLVSVFFIYLHILNFLWLQVSHLYRDVSIGRFIRIVLTRVIILEDEQVSHLLEHNFIQ